MTVEYVLSNSAISGTLINVRPLIIDKFSMTVAAETVQEEEYIKEKIYLLASNDNSIWIKAKQYELSVKTWFLSQPVLIQCIPKQSGVRFSRIEFNPSKIGFRKVLPLLDFIYYGGADTVVSNGIVTRIDAAVDIEGLTPEMIVIKASGFRIAKNFYRSGHELETQYIGGKKGLLSFCVYDKVEQLKKQNLKFGHSKPLPQIPVTRIEARIKPRMKLCELASLKNPFKRLEIANYSSLSKTAGGAIFLNAVRHNGFPANWALLTPSDKKRFSKIMGISKCLWWSPEKLWTDWENLVVEFDTAIVKTEAMQLTA